MRKDDKGAEALKEKLDRLTEPEKRLVLAYISGMKARKEPKDSKSDTRGVRNPD